MAMQIGRDGGQDPAAMGFARDIEDLRRSAVDDFDRAIELELSNAVSYIWRGMSPRPA